MRLGNAALSHWRYVGKFFWPADLAVYYPHPGRGLSLGLAAAAGLLLAAVTALALALWRRRPWLAAGWLWYVGMLLPMIGLVQFGDLALADRFTYLPLVGLALALVWTARDLCAGQPRCGRVLPAVAVALTCALAALSVTQLRLWRDSVTLLGHTLAVTGDNPFVRANLGWSLAGLGRYQEAFRHYQEALRLAPAYAEAHNNFGVVLARLGRLREAEAEFREAVRLKPQLAPAWSTLGYALARQGRHAEAEACYREVLRLEPDNPDAHDNLAELMRAFGRPAEELRHRLEAGRLRSAR